ncbi:MAG: hypothetical protein ACYSWO_21780 [Planctomycetota bacterium]
MSEFLPCSKRQSLVAYQRDGSKLRVQHCAEEKATKGGQQVEPKDCKACEIRGTILRKAISVGTYKHATPPNLIGPSKSEADREKSGLWPPCNDREILTFKSCCGGTRQAKVCRSVNCETFGGEVSPVICTACAVREE